MSNIRFQLLDTQTACDIKKKYCGTNLLENITSWLGLRYQKSNNCVLVHSCKGIVVLTLSDPLIPEAGILNRKPI